MKQAEMTEKAQLPENAYTELAKGEEYAPVVPSSALLPEMTRRSVLWGSSFVLSLRSPRLIPV